MVCCRTRMGARLGLALLTIVVLATARTDAATRIIGDWEAGNREGWVDWNSGSPTEVVGAPTFAFNSIGATHGTGAIQYNSPGGYTQWLAIKLQLDVNDVLSNGIADYRADFLANTKLGIDVTLVASEQTEGNDFANMGLFLNSNTYGFERIGDPNNDNGPESITPNFTGHNGATKGWNPSLLVGTQTSTWVYDIGFLHDGNTENGEVVTGNYVELIFEAYSNNSFVIHFDNVRFFTPQTLTADFNNSNAVDAADLGVWKTGFGLTGQTNHNNGDANGDGTVDGADNLAWQQQLGSTAAAPAFGAVPEPAAAALAIVAALVAATVRRKP